MQTLDPTAVNDNFCERLSKAAMGNTKLREITIPTARLTSKGMEHLAIAIGRLEELRKLHLIIYLDTVTDLNVLFQNLRFKKPSNLLKLVMEMRDGQGPYTGVCPDAGPFLAGLKSVTHFYLKSPLRMDGHKVETVYRCIFPGIQENKSITDVIYCGPDSVAREFATALSRNTSITKLNYSRMDSNNTRDETGTVLGRAYLDNSNLTQIVLHDADVAAMFSELLPRMNHLQGFLLEDLHVVDISHCRMIANGMCANNSVTKLQANFLDMDKQVVGELLTGMKHVLHLNTALKYFETCIELPQLAGAGNDVGAARMINHEFFLRGFGDFVDGLKVNKTLMRVSCMNIDLDDAAARVLGKAMEHISIESLCLASNHLNTAGYEDIVQGLKANTTIQYLDCANNNIDFTNPIHKQVRYYLSRNEIKAHVLLEKEMSPALFAQVLGKLNEKMYHKPRILEGAEGDDRLRRYLHAQFPDFMHASALSMRSHPKENWLSLMNYLVRELADLLKPINR